MTDKRCYPSTIHWVDEEERTFYGTGLYNESSNTFEQPLHIRGNPEIRAEFDREPMGRCSLKTAVRRSNKKFGYARVSGRRITLTEEERKINDS